MEDPMLVAKDSAHLRRSEDDKEEDKVRHFGGGVPRRVSGFTPRALRRTV